MKESLFIITLWFSAILVYAQHPPAKKPGNENTLDSQAIRLETTLVTIPVSVLDKKGRFINDLRAEDFRVYEDKIEQEIVYFDSAEKPFAIALLLDISDSAKLKVKDIQDSAIKFIDQLKPEDRIIVLSFDKQITLLADTTSSHEQAKLAIKQIKAGGGTSLYDAVGTAINNHLSLITDRKAILLFTDGEDTTSARYTYEHSLQLIEEFDGLLYAIQYNTFDDVSKDSQATLNPSGMMVKTPTTAKGELLTVAHERATRYLRLSSTNTGGRFFYADTPKNLSEAFVRIAGDLRQQYSLSYYPSNQSQEKSKRQIKVQTRLPDVVLRFRKYYIYKPLDKLPAK